MKYSKMKKTMAVIGIAALLACPNGALTAMAEEDPQTQKTETETQDGSETKDETKGKTTEDENDESEDEKDKNKDEGSKNATSDGEDSDGNTKSTSNPKPYSTIDNAKSSNGTREVNNIQSPKDLKWDENGNALFTNPNNFDCGYEAQLYKEGKWIDKWKDTVGANKNCSLDFFVYFDECGEGKYTFDVAFVDENGKPVNQSKSSEYTYTKPNEEKTLPQPKLEKIEDGDTIKINVSIEADEALPKMQFGYYVMRGNSQVGYTTGTQPHFESGKTEHDWTIDFTEFLNKYGSNIDPRYDYYIYVRSVSAEPTKWNSSEYVKLKVIEATESFDDDDDSDNSSSSSNEEASEPTPAPVYVPTTPEEKARYSVVGNETVKCTTTNSSYSVDVKNSLQGPKCFASIKAVLGDYTIGRTFNILPQGQYVYHTDTKARITLTIPQALQAAGRTYKMICVTENGQPIELQDLDTSANTITFETDTYYAFALVYKDGAAN